MFMCYSLGGDSTKEGLKYYYAYINEIELEEHARKQMIWYRTQMGGNESIHCPETKINLPLPSLNEIKYEYRRIINKEYY